MAAIAATPTPTPTPTPIFSPLDIPEPEADLASVINGPAEDDVTDEPSLPPLLPLLAAVPVPLEERACVVDAAPAFVVEAEFVVLV